MRETRSLLASECDALCEYLVGCGPPAALREHYIRAHELGRVGAAAGRIDRLLVTLARGGSGAAALADSVAVVAARRGLLRRKLVLLLALLESSRETWRLVDTADDESQIQFFARSALAGLGFAARAVCGAAAVAALALLSPYLALEREA